MRTLALILALAALPAAAHAGEVSPRLWSQFFSGSHDGKPIRVAATLEGRATPALLRALTKAGAQPVELAVGGRAEVGRLLSLDVPRARLAAVAAVPGVLRLAPAVPLWRRLALDRTAVLAGAAQAWHARNPAERQLDGGGVTIADHEMAWDPLHPDLFFPDGGLFDWNDANSDGRLGAGDTVALDGRLVTLQLLEPAIDDPFTGGHEASPRGLDPGLDWVYADLNGNGRRDTGAAFAGQPAMGEPIWMPDDVDGNGVVSAGEKLVRLGTPKISAIYDQGQLFQGAAIATYQAPGDRSHGLAVTSILAGGWPGLRRFTGMAPASQLVLISAEDPIEAVAVGDRLGADVQLWEFASLVDSHDGSSPLEEAISESARQGTVQLTATGNIGGSGHNMRIAPLASMTTVSLQTAPPGVFPAEIVIAILTWRGGDQALDVTVEVPGFARVELTQQNNQSFVLEGPFAMDVDLVRETSSHGTSSIMMALTPIGGGFIANAEIALSFRPNAPVSELRGLVVDDASGWGPGAAWTSRLTQSGTALAPSTADEVIAVGAYGGVHDLSAFGFGRVGELRPYSGTGPRLDGARVVDVLGPDDPYAAAGDAQYEGFSGTSGALPHAAGAAALLISGGQRGYAAIERSLLQAALPMPGTRPNPDVGWGKVSAASALGLGHPQPGSPPSIITTLRRTDTDVEIEARATGNAPIVRLDWDLDYDLTYDLSAPSFAMVAFVDPRTTDRVVVRAVDATGQVARKLVRVADALCSPGTCLTPGGLCQPCGSIDAGIQDARVVPLPDARPADPDAGATSRPDSGGGAPDSTASEPDGGLTARPRTLETIAREDWTCGCQTARGAGDAGAPWALGMWVVAWVVARRRRPSEFRVCRTDERGRIDRS